MVWFEEYMQEVGIQTPQYCYHTKKLKRLIVSFPLKYEKQVLPDRVPFKEILGSAKLTPL